MVSKNVKAENLDLDSMAVEAEEAAPHDNMWELFAPTLKSSQEYFLSRKKNNNRPDCGLDWQRNNDKERNGFRALRRFCTDQRWSTNCRLSALCLPQNKIPKATMHSTNENATGPYDIPVEPPKGYQTSVKMMYLLYLKIWEKKRSGDGMEEGMPYQSSKKGDLGLCVKLHENNIAVHPWQILQQSSAE